MSFAESHLGQIRQAWGSAPILFPGVLVVILNAAGEVLLGRRDDFGAWSAIGGSMELGESILETLHREVLEETSVKVRDEVFFGMMTAAKYQVVYPHGDVTQAVNALFVVHLEHDDVVMDWEHSSFGWYAQDALPDEVTPQTLRLMEMYQDFLRSGLVQVD